MTSHFSILPTDIWQLLASSLDSTFRDAPKPLRILRLPHPRTGLPSLFLPQEWLSPSSQTTTRTGVLELQAVCPPDERSWILSEDIVADGKMLTMTPIDPAFLLLPIVQMAQPDDNTTQFRTSEDIFEAAAVKFEASVDGPEGTSLREDITQFCTLACAKQALTRLCEVKEISSDIVVYRYTSTKFVKYLRAKVNHLEKCTALDGSLTVVRGLAKDGLMEDGQESLLQLGRIRACCDLVAQYLPTEIRDALVSSYDFAPLQKHVEAIMAEAVSKAVAAPAPKKSKAAQEKEKEKESGAKKRKSTKASHGVETLKKANTTGMSKLSSFFDKAK